MDRQTDRHDSKHYLLTLRFRWEQFNADMGVTCSRGAQKDFFNVKNIGK